MRQAELFDTADELPNGLVYQPGFLDAAEEATLLEGIRTLTLREATYKAYTAKRRVASFGAGYDFDANELTPAPELAPFLLPLRARVAEWAGVAPPELGYALVAEYAPGTQLGWHRDVPQFETVVGVSLASASTMRLRRFPPRAGAPILRLPLAPRSAYILQGEARWAWQHSIAPTPQLRYLITFRTRRSQV
jgi:alkylated DNA repair dioxygenase AlkB